MPMKRIACLAAALALFSAVAFAQDYPNKSITIIVPFPPGGAVDLIARLMQPKMSESLGQPYLIENRGGAAGNLGVEQVARGAQTGF